MYQTQSFQQQPTNGASNYDNPQVHQPNHTVSAQQVTNNDNTNTTEATPIEVDDLPSQRLNIPAIQSWYVDNIEMPPLTKCSICDNPYIQFHSDYKHNIQYFCTEQCRQTGNKAIQDTIDTQFYVYNLFSDCRVPEVVAKQFLQQLREEERQLSRTQSNNVQQTSHPIAPLNAASSPTHTRGHYNTTHPCGNTNGHRS